MAFAYLDEKRGIAPVSRVLNQLEETRDDLNSPDLPNLANPAEVSGSTLSLVPESMRDNLRDHTRDHKRPDGWKLARIAAVFTFGTVGALCLALTFMKIGRHPAPPKIPRTDSTLETSALNRQAIQAYYSRDLAHAYDTLKGLTANHPENAALWANLGVVLHAQGKSAEAAASFMKAIDEQAPGDHESSARMTALNGLGVLRMEATDYEAARNYFTRALRVLPQPESVAASEAVFLNLGKLSERQGQWKEAEKYYSKLLGSAAASAATKEMIASRLKKIEQGLR